MTAPITHAVPTGTAIYEVKAEVLAHVAIADVVRSSGVHLEKKGNALLGFCPFHDDQHTPNFTVYEKGGFGRFKCHACRAGGNVIDFVMKREGVDFKEALVRLAQRTGILGPNGKDHHRRGRNTPSHNPPILQHPTGKAKISDEKDTKEPVKNDSSVTSCTLEQYAESKGLPPDCLKALGLSNSIYQGKPAVRIPYYGPDGTVLAIRFRTGLKKEVNQDNRFRWLVGDKPKPYGLNRLEEARKAGYVSIVEGESDCHTLWLHGEPALGLPGADTWRDEWAEYLKGIPIVYVVVEPDKGGETVKEKISKSPIRERVRFVTLGKTKDANALYLHDKDGFKAAWQVALNAAIPAIEKAGHELIGGASGTRRMSQATRLVTLVVGAEVELWHSPNNEPYATLTIADQGGYSHVEHYPLKSQAFKRWMAQLYYKSEKGAASSQGVLDALGVLAGMAIFEGKEHPVFVRLAEHEGAIYLDLGDEHWRAVKVTVDDWSVVENPPVKFKRARGQLALPVPVRGGVASEICQFINLPNEQSRALLIAYLVSSLRPSGPFPVLVLVGEQGTGKSGAARAIRSLIDPNAAPLRSEPKDARDLMIAATNGWMPIFDNLSHIPASLSDALCRLSTGGGFATRELYTDAEEMLFDAQRPVVLTSIEDVATRGDLLDRAIILTLAPIPDDKRRAEAGLWSEFEEARPRILGALLDAVSAAMRNLPSTHLDRLPRMADFALWSVAAEEALGPKVGTFLEAYTANRENASSVILETPVAQELLSFMQDIREWKGSASDLLVALNKTTTEPEKHQKAWPKDGRSLASNLRRLAPNLRESDNLDVQFGGRAGKKGKRIIQITNLVFEKAQETSSASSAATVATCETADNADTTSSKSDANGHDHANVASAEAPEHIHENAQVDDTDDADAKSETFSSAEDDGKSSGKGMMKEWLY